MGFKRIIKLNANSKIGIWELNESISDLEKISPNPNNLNIKNKKRKKEYLTTGLLLKKLTEAKLEYNDFGAPILTNDMHISISHTVEYLFIAISSNPIAIDAEICSNKALRLTEKFINTNRHCKITKNHATIIWCSKECIFKLYQKRKIDFKSDIIITPFTVEKTGTVTARFLNKRHKLNYQKLYNHYLVYVCN